MSKTPKGQWEQTDVQNLLRHRNSGLYYGRFRVMGKRKFYPLETDKKTIAKLRLLGKSAEIEKQRQATTAAGSSVQMKHLFEVYRSRFRGSSSLSEATKDAREDHLKRIEKTWPALAEKAPSEVKLAEIHEWSNLARRTTYRPPGAKKPKKYSNESINKSVDTLRRVFRIAVERGAILQSPFDSETEMAGKLKVTDPKRKLRLPSAVQMEQVFATVERPKACSKPGLFQRLKSDAADVGELVRFLAYTGARLEEARRATWEDVGRHTIAIHGTKSEHSRDRDLPINPALARLLESMRARRATEGVKCRDRILCVSEAEKSLRRACAAVGVQRLRHHDLRHYFATVVIESGVDIPTLSRWLGHADGGALAMRTYGHLRQEHSIAAAQKVNFGQFV